MARAVEDAFAALGVLVGNLIGWAFLIVLVTSRFWLARFLYYMRDTGIPKHRVNYNYILDLPFGKGILAHSQQGRGLRH